MRANAVVADVSEVFGCRDVEAAAAGWGSPPDGASWLRGDGLGDHLVNSVGSRRQRAGCETKVSIQESCARLLGGVLIARARTSRGTALDCHRGHMCTRASVGLTRGMLSGGTTPRRHCGRRHWCVLRGSFACAGVCQHPCHLIYIGKLMVRYSCDQPLADCTLRNNHRQAIIDLFCQHSLQAYLAYAHIILGIGQNVRGVANTVDHLSRCECTTIGWDERAPSLHPHVDIVHVLHCYVIGVLIRA